MIYATYALVIVLLAAGNRYAGMAYPLNKEVFGALFGVSAWLLGHSYIEAGAVAALAYAARQWLSHGAVYRLDHKARHRGPWLGICFTRCTLPVLPLAAAPIALIPATVLGAIACLYTNVLCRRLEDTRWTKDMLLVAEPMQGAIYALVLISVTVWG